MVAIRKKPVCPRPRVRGFTLIEFIIALVVIAVGASLLVSFVSPTASSVNPMLQVQARAVAAAYMDEILLRDFSGSCAGGRGQYQSIWCYHGLAENPRNQFGNAIPELEDYSVRVAVTTAGDDAAITVDVSHNSGRADIGLHSLRGNY